MAITLRLTKGEALTFEELDGNFSELNTRTTTLETSKPNWDAAYGWGDHSLQGYITFYEETDPIFVASAAYNITTQNITNWSTAYNWGNHATQGYLTSLGDTNLNDLGDVSISNPTPGHVLQYNGTIWVSAVNTVTETDPVFTASAAGGITTQNITDWNTAYGWGDHSVAGYIGSSDPAGGITAQNITDWNTAYGWGDHSVAGYLTQYGTVANHSDVSLAGISDGQVLEWSASNNRFVPTSINSASVTISDTTPANPESGDLWWDSTVGVLKVYYNDGTSLQWVDATPQTGYSTAQNLPTAVGFIDMNANSPTWSGTTGYTVAKSGGDGTAQSTDVIYTLTFPSSYSARTDYIVNACYDGTNWVAGNGVQIGTTRFTDRVEFIIRRWNEDPLNLGEIMIIIYDL